MSRELFEKRRHLEQQFQTAAVESNLRLKGVLLSESGLQSCVASCKGLAPVTFTQIFTATVDPIVDPILEPLLRPKNPEIFLKIMVFY